MSEVLIVRTSALGDIVHSLPLAAALKEAYPRCRVTWLVERRYEDLLSGNPCIDRIVPVRFREWKRDLRSREGRREWLRLLRLLGRARSDVSLDPQGLARSGLLSRMSRAPVRVGFPVRLARERLNGMFTNVRPASVPADGHVIDRNLALLHPLGVRTRKRSFFFHVPAEVEDQVQGFLERAAPAGQGLRVVVHPAAGWPTKQWALERYAEIARRMAAQWDARVFLFWGPGERRLAESLERLVPSSAGLIPEMGIKAAIAFLRECDLFVGGDSGPLHVASALGKPVVGLYGPSDPVRNGPFLGRFRVVKSGLPCVGCFRRRCAGARCMEAITVDEVWGALSELVREIEARPRTIRRERNGPG